MNNLHYAESHGEFIEEDDDIVDMAEEQYPRTQASRQGAAPARQVDTHRSSSATLICDYSENDLNQLLLQSNDAAIADASPSNFDESANALVLHQETPERSPQLPGYGSGDKYSQLTRLNDEDENVDFMTMFQQYQIHRGQQAVAMAADEEMDIAEATGGEVIVDDGDMQAPGEMYQPIEEDEAVMLQYGSQGAQHQLMGQQNRLGSDAASVGGGSLSGQLMAPQHYPNNSYRGQPLQRPLARDLKKMGAGRQGLGPLRVGQMRPGSATVAGQAARFQQSLGSKRRLDPLLPSGGSQHHQLDDVSFSYQAPLPQVNNLMLPPKPKGAHGSAQKQAGSFGQRRRTRPQSAARNQLQPSKNLQSVTNFTYQKAKQNLNQRAYVPESMKNTDKERLYEEKINLKKKMNEMLIENQQLKTQVKTQTASIRKREEEFKLVMDQVFHSQHVASSGSLQKDEDFLKEFQQREISHNHVQSLGYKTANLMAKASKGRAGTNAVVASGKSKASSTILATKDSQITLLKTKIKELNDALTQKDRELADLKQTLKFTKLKEYEVELALNVQESHRLKQLLEAEMRRPRADPALIQQLRAQAVQQQQLAQGLQRQSELQAAETEKINKKLITQVRKVQRLRETKKRVIDRNKRLDRQVKMLQQKVTAMEKNPLPAPQERRRRRAQTNEDMRAYEVRLQQQNEIIERLCMKMQAHGVELEQADLTPMTAQEQQEQRAHEAGQNLEEVQEEGPLQEEDQRGTAPGSFLDLVVTFGATSDERREVTKHLNQTNFSTLGDLKDSLRREFRIEDSAEFLVKLINDEGRQLELSEENWEQLRGLHAEQAVDRQSPAARIQLELELLDDRGVDMDDESNYEDEFEEAADPSEREPAFLDPVQAKDVERHFDELRQILLIKGVKRGDALQYILSGARDEDGKKLKIISVEKLAAQIDERIGFYDTDVSVKMARFLIEVPEEDGRVRSLDNAEFKGQRHEQACKMRRKDLSVKFLGNLKEYMLMNGIAITSLLSRISTMFEETREELLEDLRDQDEEDEGHVPRDIVFKSIKMMGLHPDEELTDFLLFLAMRHSKSLDEINYAKLCEAMHEDFNLIDDERPIWLKEDEPLSYTPSEDEGELESDREPTLQPEQIDPAAYDQPEDGLDATNLNDVSDLQQNELLEKVDEVLCQIVHRLPPTQKIRTLTHLMMPYLQASYDPQQQKQLLIINQQDFIEFLQGPQAQQKLGLAIDDSHVYCLLHLLVQEVGNLKDDQQKQQPKFIQYDEFVELVKTYMKKELIMKQSKSLGINYDILSKESVEFLFKIRSSLMHEQANGDFLNENSEDLDDDRLRHEKPVPVQIREIFQSIIHRKNIQLKKKDASAASLQQSQGVEIMDFEQMLDSVRMRLGIPHPSARSQEELKYLMCLDYKYLEMVMLIKLDKIMQDIDYISIDLLRQAQDQDLDQSRQMALSMLRKVRQEQLSRLKALQEAKSAQKHQLAAGLGVQGVSHSTKQEKKRKRPDDKKSKKPASRAPQNQMALEKQIKGMDFDNIDVNLDTDIHPNARKMVRDSRDAARYQGADIDEEIEEVARAMSDEQIEFDDDMPINSDINEQMIEDEDVDIPIDDEEGDSGVKDASRTGSHISDNYSGFAGDDKQPSESVKDDMSEQVEEVHVMKDEYVDDVDDENVISMEHSDDVYAGGSSAKKPAISVPDSTKKDRYEFEVDEQAMEMAATDESQEIKEQAMHLNEDSEAYEEEDFDNEPNGLVDEMMREAEDHANAKNAINVMAGEHEVSDDDAAVIEDDYDVNDNLGAASGVKKTSSIPSHQPSHHSSQVSSAQLKKNLREGNGSESRKSFRKTQNSDYSKASRGLKRDDLQIDIEVAEEQAVFPDMNQEEQVDVRASALVQDDEVASPDLDDMSPQSPSSELPPRDSDLQVQRKVSAPEEFIGNDYGEELGNNSLRSSKKIELTSDKPKSSIKSSKQGSIRSLNSQQFLQESKKSPPMQTQDEPFQGSGTGQSSPQQDMALPNDNQNSNSDADSPIKELSDLGKDHIDLAIPENSELKKAPASVKLLDPEMQAAEDAKAAANNGSVEKYNMLAGFGLDSHSTEKSQGNGAAEHSSITKIITQPEPANKSSRQQVAGNGLQKLTGQYSDSIQDMNDAPHITDDFIDDMDASGAEIAEDQNLKNVNFNQFSNDESIQQQNDQRKTMSKKTESQKSKSIQSVKSKSKKIESESENYSNDVYDDDKGAAQSSNSSPQKQISQYEAATLDQRHLSTGMPAVAIQKQQIETDPDGSKTISAVKQPQGLEQRKEMQEFSQPRKVPVDKDMSQKSARTEDLRKQLEGDFSDDYDYPDGDDDAVYEGAVQQQEYHKKQMSQRASGQGYEVSPPAVSQGQTAQQDAVPDGQKQALDQKMSDFNQFVQQQKAAGAAQPEPASFDDDEYEKDEFI